MSWRAGQDGARFKTKKQKAKGNISECGELYVRPHPHPQSLWTKPQSFVIHLQIEIHLNDMAPRRGRKLPTKQLPWKLHWVSARYFLLFENINMVIHFSYQTFLQITVSNTENTSQMEMYSKKASLF